MAQEAEHSSNLFRLITCDGEKRVLSCSFWGFDREDITAEVCLTGQLRIKASKGNLELDKWYVKCVKETKFDSDLFDLDNVSVSWDGDKKEVFIRVPKIPLNFTNPIDVQDSTLNGVEIPEEGAETSGLNSAKIARLDLCEKEGIFKK